jgi:hypothetical protein
VLAADDAQESGQARRSLPHRGSSGSRVRTRAYPADMGRLPKPPDQVRRPERQHWRRLDAPARADVPPLPERHDHDGWTAEAGHAWAGHRHISTTERYADYAPSIHERNLIEAASAPSSPLNFPSISQNLSESQDIEPTL